MAANNTCNIKQNINKRNLYLGFLYHCKEDGSPNERRQPLPIDTMMVMVSCYFLLIW